MVCYLERWHRKRNPKFPRRKNLPIKSSFIPAMYENFESSKAFITAVSVMHNSSQDMKKFPQNDSNIAIYGFKVPKRILHVSNGVQMLLLINPVYQIWTITWFFNDRFRGSPPYFSNIQTNKEYAFPKVTIVVQIRQPTTLIIRESKKSLKHSLLFQFISSEKCACYKGPQLVGQEVTLI